MKKNFLGIMLLLSSHAMAAGADAFIGTYECTGHEVDTNEAFTCQVIIERTGETYSSTAKCTDGTSYRGTGVYNEKSHHLSTGFINPDNAEETGVCVSHMKANGTLVSQWTYLDKTSVGHSVCHKQ